MFRTIDRDGSTTTATITTTIVPTLTVADRALEKNGRLSLAVSCANAACAGVVKLTVARDEGRHVRHIVLARDSYSLAVGAEAAVKPLGHQGGPGDPARSEGARSGAPRQR